MNKLINYIYIGSEKRLGQLKLFKEENFEKVTKLNFSNEREIRDLLDSEVADFEGNITNGITSNRYYQLRRAN